MDFHSQYPRGLRPLQIHVPLELEAVLTTWKPLVLLLAIACTTEGEEAPTACDAAADADMDGIDDCTEDELGTDPAAADTDGDGFSDGEELDCVSDPLDDTEACYKCGWAHNDPGDLETTGSGLGDVIADINFVDQCGEDVALYDFAQEYHILFMTAVW